MSDTRTYIRTEFYFLSQKTGDDLSQDFFFRQLWTKARPRTPDPSQQHSQEDVKYFQVLVLNHPVYTLTCFPGLLGG